MDAAQVHRVGAQPTRQNGRLQIGKPLGVTISIFYRNYFQLDSKVNGNGTELQPLTKNEAINSNHSSPPNGSPPQKKIENLMMKGLALTSKCGEKQNC